MSFWIQAAPFPHRHCARKGPSSSHTAQGRGGLPFPPTSPPAFTHVQPPYFPPLTGPTMSETWETVVPEAAPR